MTLTMPMTRGPRSSRGTGPEAAAWRAKAAFTRPPSPRGRRRSSSARSALRVAHAGRYAGRVEAGSGEKLLARGLGEGLRGEAGRGGGDAGQPRRDERDQVLPDAAAGDALLERRGRCA